jgi:L-lactate utilization protein LutB
MADIQKTMKNLESRGYTALYFDTPEEAVAAAVKEVDGAAVGMGGSETMREIGMAKALMDAGCTVHSHALTPPDQNPDVYKNAQHCGVYMASANAITEEGCLVNIDGRGNRVASIAYGSKKLIIIAGINKIVPDLHAALNRVKGYAAGMNARRLGKKTPCAVDLVCRDCKSPDRLCRSVLISEGLPMGMDKAIVMLVGKELGY